MNLVTNHRKAFSLLEVIIAMVMFAIIAVPALSLMNLSARKTSNQIGLSNATELKRKVESFVAADLTTAFGWDLTGTPVALYASEDLATIDYLGSGIANSNKFYRIDILDPVGYDDGVGDHDYEDTDPYRVFVFKVIWPAFVESTPGVFISNEGNASNLEEVVLTSVVAK